MADNSPTEIDTNELQLAREQNQYQIAKLNIEANVKNNALWVNHCYRMRIVAGVLLLIALALVLAFCCVAIWLNAKDFAVRVVEIIVAFVAGGGAGYTLRARTEKSIK